MYELVYRRFCDRKCRQSNRQVLGDGDCGNRRRRAVRIPRNLREYAYLRHRNRLRLRTYAGILLAHYIVLGQTKIDVPSLYRYNA